MSAVLRRDLRWRAVASLTLVATLSALLVYQGIEVTRVDLIIIGAVLLFLTALALAWRPRDVLPEEAT